VALGSHWPISPLILYSFSSFIILPSAFAPVLFRLTINWEIIIVIPWKRRAEVIEIIWERVEPRAA
jgi:predicted sugar kinase